MREHVEANFLAGCPRSLCRIVLQIRRIRRGNEAAHESPRTMALYDRREDKVAVDEVERIVI